MVSIYIWIMDAIEKLLAEIEKESSYALLGNCYCLQGDTELGLFRVKPIEEVYQECFVDFSTGMISPFVTIGISDDKNELWRMKTEMIDNGKKDFTRGIIVDETLCAVEGEPIGNEIKITQLIAMYDRNLTLFRMKEVNRNWLLLGIAANAKIAEQHATTIRVLGGRAENPKN